MNIKIILLGLFTLSFVQCTTHTTDTTIGYKFSNQETLVFEDIDYPEILGDIMQIIKIDSLLLINDYYGDSLLTVFNLNSNKVERKLLGQGEGPNELISPLEVLLSNNNLWILSRPIHQLNHLSTQSIHKTPKLVRDLQVKTEADCFVPLTDTLFVLSGFWKKRYAWMNLQKSDELIEFGEFPDFWEAEKDIPHLSKAMFHQCHFAVNPQKHLFASCSYFVLEIYEYDPSGKKCPTLKFKKQLGKYQYKFSTDEHVVFAKMKEGCDPVSVDIVGTENHIYLLTQDPEQRKQRNILVLDWKGNPVKLLKTGQRVMCFAVDEENQMGYGIIQDPEDKLVSFKYNL